MSREEFNVNRENQGRRKGINNDYWDVYCVDGGPVHILYLEGLSIREILTREPCKYGFNAAYKQFKERWGARKIRRGKR